MSSSAAPRRSLPAVVKQLGAVSLFNDFASEMVYPLLPALVTTRLGGGAVALGALDGIAEFVAAAFKAGSGWLAERPRWRKPLIVGGYALAAVARPVMGVAGAAWHVVALRATDRFGKGVRTPPRDAIIADASPGDLRGRAFGFHRAMDHAGAVVGPLVAWALLTVANRTPSQVVGWSIVPGIVAVMVVIWALKRLPRPAEAEGREASQAPQVRSSVALFGLIVAFAFARFPETLLLLRLQDLGVSVALVPILWAALHVVRTIASYPGGWLSDVAGPRRSMVTGWLIYAVVCFGMATSGSGTVAVAWFLLYGFVAAATESPERAFVAAVGRAAQRGRRFGIYHAAIGLAALPGALLLGALYAGPGAEWAFALSGTLVVGIGVIGARLR